MSRRTALQALLARAVYAGVLVYGLMCEPVLGGYTWTPFETAPSQTAAAPLYFSNITIDGYTPLTPGSDVRDMFGGAFSSVEPGNTLFGAGLVNSTQAVAFSTQQPITIGGCCIWLTEDTNSPNRASREFALYAGPTESTMYLVSNAYTRDPYVNYYGSDNLALADTFAPLEAQYFELFVYNAPGSVYNLGPRICEFQVSSVPGDTNFDGVVNALDIDAIYSHFGAGNNQWDVNGDGAVNQEDVADEIYTILGTTNGDANLDKKVNFADFQILLDHWQVKSVGWAGGDFNGDSNVNFLDFQYMLDNWNPMGYGSEIPEPATLSLLALGGLALFRRKRN